MDVGTHLFVSKLMLASFARSRAICWGDKYWGDYVSVVINLSIHVNVTLSVYDECHAGVEETRVGGHIIPL